jgi:ribonuclease BN (tRNA processing enzyme)
MCAGCPAADAARIAQEAAVAGLTLIHLDPTFSDHAFLLEDAAPIFDACSSAEHGLRSD